ncbi:MAG TPA: tetratricopeptide repeat protein, partial [Thermoanaerobaculia bacterium]|nr:tetratricopeptide repeat protein [Thermoanaerobaculia bacterium]
MIRGVRREAATFAALLIAAAAAALSAQAPPSPSSNKLGRIDFSTSGTPDAQAHFLTGALLLHSFEFEDAATEFRKAEEIEPGFAMAYWGEAMTYNHPLWAEQDLDAARKALEKLAATPEARRAKAPTLREKMYLDAVEALYGDGDKPARDRAYSEAMRRLYEQFPDDLDGASFYALSILGACEGKRDTAQYMKAAAIVEEVFAKNPDHPGAAHYLIHCYDDPVHAPLGMRAARVYATIAPSATHALHMPSHIFLASGMWPEVVSSNEASWKASVDRADRLKLGPDAHSFHALSWLEYGYLQQGRYADARKTLALMEADAAAGASSGRAKAGFASMRAAYVVETRRWKSDAVAMQTPADDAHRDLDLFTTGFAAIESGDRAGARKALAAMSAKPSTGGGGGGGSAHSHGGGAMSYSGGSSADAVLRQLLEARIEMADGNRDRAITRAKSAAALEDGLNYEFGPPDVVKPAHELLGEMLLEAGRPADARKEFETALARYPGRALSLLGLARAASKAGDAAAAKDAYARLAAIWSRADTDVPELAEVRSG